ncbi:MAG: cell surface protein [Defluviitaleaceae bacterium]|nr:cell surface protein [Defluviitaleaceae bacterium]MCL2835342.1 cell surface protein [Defluviitaleaceae bacterium]
MAVVSGRVIFDSARTAQWSDVMPGIAGVAVALQNIATNELLAVLTGTNGEYSFINVPNGNYRIVESYGLSAVPAPGDFNNAAAAPIPDGVTPPISYVTNPPTGSTNLDCTVPNTIFVTVSDNDLNDQNFLNGTVRYTPITAIMDSCATIDPENLLTDADDGTFGFFPAGTPANTGAPTEPYPGFVPGFAYVLPDPAVDTPDDGEYTVQNIMNNSLANERGAWWRIADHTTGNETGRMMVINGYDPGTVFIHEEVNVLPNTNYLFSAWILNMFKVTGYANPAFGVLITDDNGDVLYSHSLGAEIPVNMNTPEWKQIGTVFNSQDNTHLTFEFLSQAPAAWGNDYALDDIALHEVDVPVFTPVKSVNPSRANVGDTVTYTVTLENTCQSPLTNVRFQDTVPNGLSFVTGSVRVNSAPNPGANPNIGFTIANVPGESTVTIQFSALVTSVPLTNPVLNQADMSYNYTPVEGGIPGESNVSSNIVPLDIGDSADLSVVKTGSPSVVKPGETLTYTITVANAGPTAAENVTLTDAHPIGLSNLEYSIDGGASFQAWTGNINLGMMDAGDSLVVIIQGTVNEDIAGRYIYNIAEVSSTTPDPNYSNNTSSIRTEIFTPRTQAITDIIESVALQETALSHILNAEGEKMQTMLGMNDVTIDQLFELNRSVTRLVGTITRLESVLQAKLNSVK